LNRIFSVVFKGSKCVILLIAAGAHLPSANWEPEAIDPRDILIKIWVAFGTLGGVISLASLFDSIVAWVDFIRQIIISYRGIVDTIWGPILAIFPFDAPRWIHDYLTICGLTAVAVLWALHRTSVELGFDKIGSTFSAIGRMFFDFSVAKSALSGFAKNAKDPQKLGHPVAENIVALVNELARQSLPWVWRIFNICWIATLVIVVPIAPYVLPFVMFARDRSDIARARKLLGQRREELNAADVEPEIRDSLGAIFDKQVSGFITFEAINQLYYGKVLRNQLWYYAAVLVFFLMLVFANYVVLRMQSF